LPGLQGVPVLDWAAPCLPAAYLHYNFTVAGEVCGNSARGPVSSSRVEADIY
jgi:hypothetical protein